MNRLNADSYRKMLLAAAERIIRCEPALTAYDGAIGDGDHGIGMKNGMTAAEKVLEQEGSSDIRALNREVSAAMRNAMGGASGMIFSTLFAGAADSDDPLAEIDADGLADQLARGLEAIQKLGHAQEGDKTMVDALAPAVRAMRASSGSLEEMLKAAAEAAREGAEKTKGYVARFGRSKNLGERALGHMDAGSVSTWQILTAFSDFVSGTDTPLPVPEGVKEPAAEGAPAPGGKKLINRPEDVVKETAEGFLAAFGKDYAAVPGVNGLVRRNIPQGKTALLAGGGSGHEPMFGFFLGENLADAAANGNIFTSPDPETVYRTAKAAERGAGVLFLYGNYAGDVMNFDLAAEMLAKDGIPTRTVRVWDDVASAPKERKTDRRGIAGDVLMLKIAGAACARYPLDEAWRIVSKANDNLYSVGVGLEGVTIPGTEKPIFTLPADEIEYGLGIHGEPGVRRMKMQTADEIMDHFVDLILKDSGIREGDRVCTYVNGLGKTTLMELMILNRRLAQLLGEKGILIHDMDVGSYVTTLEMAGASVSVLKLDDELQALYDVPCRSPYYNKF